MKGRVLTAHGGFYEVLTEGGLYTCRLRGKNKRGEQIAVAGDWVAIAPGQQAEGTIESIYPRKNVLHRPSLSNIDQLIILSALKDPEVDFLLIDRLLVIAHYHQIRPLLVFNKVDLTADLTAVQAYYRDSYPVFRVSARDRLGVEGLLDELSGKTTAIAGQSGVGKSTLINALTGSDDQATASVSDKLKRGRHTTRTTRFIPFESGFIVDTPGFNMLHLPKDLEGRDLSHYYPDFMDQADGCQYRDCLHINEPVCGVKTAVHSGILSDKRYQNYCTLLSELE
ncbi:ribosome small subunit-dependent GTPase A [Peptococcus simiae]|uniref:ribosome small subunit-dependent GTPase A n=1 Tax=Peptococcus simiae TaxID=1643805 RepID=UPI00397F9A31